MKDEISNYLEQVPEDRKQAFESLRNIIIENLPQGFEEMLYCGMPSFVVPFSLYPKGYHCDAKQPLPFVSIANQKGHIAIYHMALYTSPILLQWLQAELSKSDLKIEMGKSCIKFKKVNQMPFDLIAQLMTKLNPNQWIELYESVYVKK